MKTKLFLLFIPVVMVIAAVTVPYASALDSSPVVTGSYDSGDVVVELIPDSYKNGMLTIKVSMNTHSVSLGQFDLKEITELEYNGRKYRPVKAKSGGGHHAYGKLVFEISEEPVNYTVTITGIPMVERRVFEWK